MKVRRIRTIAEVEIDSEEKRLIQIAVGNAPKEFEKFPPVVKVFLETLVNLRSEAWETMLADIEKHGYIPMQDEQCQILSQVLDDCTGCTARDRAAIDSFVKRLRGLAKYLKTETPAI